MIADRLAVQSCASLCTSVPIFPHDAAAAAAAADDAGEGLQGEGQVRKRPSIVLRPTAIAGRKRRKMSS